MTSLQCVFIDRAFNVDFEQISHVILVFPLSTLNKQSRLESSTESYFMLKIIFHVNCQRDRYIKRKKLLFRNLNVRSNHHLKGFFKKAILKDFTKLTYFSSMLHFYSPWKRQVSDVFRGYRNGTLGLNGLSFPVLSCQLCVLDYFFFCFRWQFFNICQAIQSNKVLVSLEWRMIQLQIYYKLVCNKCKNVSFFRIYLDCAWTSESWQNLGLQKINLF